MNNSNDNFGELCKFVLESGASSAALCAFHTVYKNFTSARREGLSSRKFFVSVLS